MEELKEDIETALDEIYSIKYKNYSSITRKEFLKFLSKFDQNMYLHGYALMWLRDETLEFPNSISLSYNKEYEELDKLLSNFEDDERRVYDPRYDFDFKHFFKIFEIYNIGFEISNQHVNVTIISHDKIVELPIDELNEKVQLKNLKYLKPRTYGKLKFNSKEFDFHIFRGKKYLTSDTFLHIYMLMKKGVRFEFDDIRYFFDDSNTLKDRIFVMILDFKTFYYNRKIIHEFYMRYSELTKNQANFEMPKVFEKPFQTPYNLYDLSNRKIILSKFFQREYNPEEIEQVSRDEFDFVLDGLQEVMKNKNFFISGGCAAHMINPNLPLHDIDIYYYEDDDLYFHSEIFEPEGYTLHIDRKVFKEIKNNISSITNVTIYKSNDKFNKMIRIGMYPDVSDLKDSKPDFDIYSEKSKGFINIQFISVVKNPFEVISEFDFGASKCIIKSVDDGFEDISPEIYREMVLNRFTRFNIGNKTFEFDGERHLNIDATIRLLKYFFRGFTIEGYDINKIINAYKISLKDKDINWHYNSHIQYYDEKTDVPFEIQSIYENEYVLTKYD